MTIRINLALQGGGAHGAFTWGVLDRLLDDEDIEVAAITGASAGALNGAAFKAGLVKGGRDGARKAMQVLWDQVGSVGDLRLTAWMFHFDAAHLAQLVEKTLPISPAETWSRLVSPYAYGPLYRNPLRPVVEAFDFDCVCADDGPALFVCATRVRTGKIRVFEGADISTDAILASACLPEVFQAIEINDPETKRVEAYWDGGYTGNPAIFPLFNKGLPDDVVIVNINPLVRDEIPKTPQEIQNRINEISFNSSLLRELRAINFVTRLIDERKMKRSDMSRVLVHMIADDELMTDLSAATKMMAAPKLLKRLKDAGRAAADRFLAEHKADLGQRGTVNLPEMFG